MNIKDLVRPYFQISAVVFLGMLIAGFMMGAVGYALSIYFQNMIFLRIFLIITLIVGVIDMIIGIKNNQRERENDQ